MIAILDYGSGNLRSAERAFALTGHETVVTRDPEICLKSAGLVVPGVGAYGSCMEQLIAVGGDEIISERTKAGNPIFGICVGMQIFFDEGIEKQGHAGLGLFPGVVKRIDAPILPHMGWNTVTSSDDSQLFQGVRESSFYFVHSFAAKVAVPGATNTWCQYGENFLAAVERGAVSAVQFHPEKSGDAGARLIMNWVNAL